VDAFENDAVNDAVDALWDGAEDLGDDWMISESNREKMRRAGRTLVQGVVAAVIVGAGPAVWAAFQNDPTDVKAMASAGGTAALAAVVAFFHRKR